MEFKGSFSWKSGVISGIIVGVVIIAVFILGNSVGWWEVKPGGVSNNKQAGAPAGATTTAAGYIAPNIQNALPTVQGGTRQEIQQKIATPGTGATGTPPGVAIPTVVQQTGAIASRDFNITGAGGKFSPDTIVVNQGDVINLTLSASDGTYNIFFPDFGVTLTAQKGGTATAQFQPSNYGQYQFYCKDVCSGNPKGTLIVNQK
jgi:heme/copper-type cytochrome/quinol oxidase subunit 2